MALGDVRPAAVSDAREGWEGQFRAARRQILGERFTHDPGDRLVLPPGVELQIALERLGHEDGRPFHMTYDSISQAAVVYSVT